LPAALAVIAGLADKIPPRLANVPETMLWALHNRASEARRSDGVLVDPESIRIHEAMDYDFAGNFGNPAGSLAVRAAEIDRVLRRWLEQSPDGLVVSLGEGLETQARRVDNGRVRWLSVDLPDSIRLRERFIPPTARFRHLALSALDPAWMDAVDPSAGVFIVAQGLLMYLDPRGVADLFTAIGARFPAAEMVFDTIPPWFSHLTLMGLRQTPRYQLPRMPWGINRAAIEPTLRRWAPGIGEVAFLDYGMPRGLPLLLESMSHHIPQAQRDLPTLAHVRMAAPNTALNTATFGADSMNAIQTDEPDTAGIGGVLAAARRSAEQANDLTLAAAQVVAQRMALGMAGALDPARTDHAEFARMVPEKVAAFSAANAIMLRYSGMLAREMARRASAEVEASVRATLAMACCATPKDLATAQGSFMAAWFERTTTNLMAIAMMSLGAQDAAMVPLRQQVAENVARLAA
jgi:O-methyltransferase involved in polyketide biosynthesis